MGIVLIRRETCGLCELAVGLLAEVGMNAVPERYLEDDVALESTYGWRIPVLRDDVTGRELDWPFDAPGVLGFLGRAGAQPR